MKLFIYIIGAVIVFGLTHFASEAGSEDLGTIGPIFPVAEPSLWDIIQDRLAELEETGAVDDLREEMQGRTRDYVERPPSAGFYVPVEDYYSYEVDLSIVVTSDLADHNGVVFARAGETVNPLDFSQFNKRIVVIDGDRDEEVRFAVGLGSEFDVTLVLVNGEPLRLQAEYGRRFYFDQQAAIADRFLIQRTPSVVTRRYPVMLVEEIPLGSADVHSD